MDENRTRIERIDNPVHYQSATMAFIGAGYQNRTDDGRLEIYSFTIKLIPHKLGGPPGNRTPIPNVQG